MDNLREALAALAHEQWSGWMTYLFSKCQMNAYRAGDAVIPAKFVEHWLRQLNTSYEALSEEEKESDRQEADRVIRLISGEKS